MSSPRHVWDGERITVPGVPADLECYRHPDGVAVYDRMADRHVFFDGESVFDHGKLEAGLVNLAAGYRRAYP